MKRLTISMWGLAIFFYLSVNAISQIIYNDVGHIPQPDQLDWTNAGRLPGTPTIADVVFNVDSYTGSDNAKVQLALASAKSAAGTAIVYFPARTYTLTSPIVLDYSIDGTNGNNIVFQGAGSDATILNFTIGKNNSCFKILGQLTGSPTTLNANVVKGSKNISASSFSGYATGNWIRLCEPNNPYVYEDWAKADKVVGQITQLEAVGSTTATMKDEASKLYSTSYGTWIQRVLPIENVGIENLKIKRMDGDEATVDGEGSNIQFSYAVNCWIKGVESEYTCRHHVAVRFSSQIEVSGCYFYNAASYDIGGRGYGVLLECSSTNCLIENNIFRHLRHAMLIQAGANCNVVTYNYSKDQYWKAYGLPNPAEGADLSLHGNYPYANLIEQNYVARIIADDYHGDNGPYNAFVRNYAYDDQGDKWGYISLHNAPNSSALGCEVSGTLYNGGVIGHGSTTWSVEFYGIYVDPNDPNHDTYETGIIYTHYLIFMQPGVRPNTFLADVSYYYSSVPDFIYSSPCSFPSIGPRYSSLTSQNIPARDRYDNSSIKTYISDPTLKPMTSSGTLTYDETWSGTHTLTGDVTIPSGITLTILPGAEIRIPTSKKITVEGILKAVGTSGNMITFTKSSSSKWWGIKFDDASDACQLKYCTLEHAYYGAYGISSAPDIRHCTFQENNMGVYCAYPASNHGIDYNNFIQNKYCGISLYRHAAEIKYNTIQGNGNHGINCNECYYTTIPRFYGNNITNHTSKGIQLYDSDPIIVQNNVYENYDGMYFNGYSLPEFRDWDDEPGHNVVVNNTRDGIYIGDEAEPDMGGYAYGYNSIYGNDSYNVYSLQPWEIDATNNYWNGVPDKVEGNVDCEPYLDYDPNPGEPPGMGKRVAMNSAEGLTSPLNGDLNEHYQKARAYEKSRQYNEAIIEFKYVIDNYPDSPEAKLSLAHIRKCYKKLDTLDALSSLLQEVSTKYPDKELGAMASFATIPELIVNREIDEALSVCSKISNNFSKTTLGRDALFETWQLHFNMTRDLKAARKVIEKYEKNYGIDDNLIFMKLAMGDITGEEANEMSKLVQNTDYKQPFTSEQEKTAEVPEIFELLRNYPNPFNPVTTIPFGLPEAAHVRIDIYDATGRLVKTLKDRDYKAGSYQVQFNATGLASGIYFVRAEMVSSENLLRSYMFTNKIVLLK